MTIPPGRDVVSSQPSYRFIPLTQGQFAVVDAADFEWLNQWQWIAHWSPRAKCYSVIRGGNVKMHRFLMKPPKGKVVDHWNGDSTDNRRCNLRIATQRKNSQNCATSRNNTSGCTGVYFCKATQKWEAYIHLRGHRKVLGQFDIFENAVSARKNAEKRHFGEVIRSTCPARITDRPTIAIERPQRVNNTSGTVGISLHRRTGKWMARVFADKTTYYLGLHDTQALAHKAIAGHHACH